VSRRTIRSSRAKYVSLLAAGALAVALNVASGTAAFAHEGRFVEHEHSRFAEHDRTQIIERGDRDFDDCGCDDGRFERRHHGRFEHGRFERHHHGRFERHHHGRRDFDDCFCDDERELPFFPFIGHNEREDVDDSAVAILNMGDNDHHIGL